MVCWHQFYLKLKKISIGIDTSCYTTSLVAIDEDNTILYSGRTLLKVKEGTVGLRQSDAFFQHVQNLPDLYEACTQSINPNAISNITVSNKPRAVEGSYMPVFTAGVQFARVIADSLGLAINYVSHQENHLYATAYNHELPDDFIGVHISGGTSEILKVHYDQTFTINIIGKTLDLSFGKLIDRVGVYMGVPFPCGKALDDLSIEQKTYPLKLSIKDEDFNISGIENQLKKHFDEDQDVSKVAYTIFEYTAKVLIKILTTSMIKYAVKTVVMSGGVTANRTIRMALKNHFKNNIIFTDVMYSTDHSIGNAYYGNVVKTY